MGVDKLENKEQQNYFSVMAEIKLTYFNAKGRAEVLRLILAYGGVEYVDERLTGEQFGARKSSLRYTQVPMLTYNGEPIYQSLTIARFLAAEFNLVGKNNVEAAQANEIVDSVADLVDARYKVIFGPEAERETGMKKFLTETAATGLGRLEKLLIARGGQFLVGNQLTWADLYVFAFYDAVGNTGLLNGFPGLTNLAWRVEGLPNIKKYLASRPVTQM